jgi:hypothetical protein
MNVVRALDNKNHNFSINVAQLSERIGKFDYNKDIVNLFNYFIHDHNSMSAVNVIAQMPNILPNNNLTRLNLYKSNLELSHRGSFVGRSFLNTIRNRMTKDELRKSALSLSNTQLIQIRPPQLIARDSDNAAASALHVNVNTNLIENHLEQARGGTASTYKMCDTKYLPTSEATSDEQTRSIQSQKFENMPINRGSVSQRIHAYNNMLSQMRKPSQSSQFNDRS